MAWIGSIWVSRLLAGRRAAVGLLVWPGSEAPTLQTNSPSPPDSGPPAGAALIIGLAPVFQLSLPFRPPSPPNPPPNDLTPPGSRPAELQHPLAGDVGPARRQARQARPRRRAAPRARGRRLRAGEHRGDRALQLHDLRPHRLPPRPAPQPRRRTQRLRQELTRLRHRARPRR